MKNSEYMSDDLHHIDRIASLIIKYHEGKISEQEARELTEWRDLSEDNRLLLEKLAAPDYIQDRINELPELEALKNDCWEKVLADIEAEEAALPAEEAALSADDAALPQAVTKRRLPTRYFAAAAVLLIAAGVWLFIRENPGTNPGISKAPSSRKDIAPGGNRATLTLSNGSSIILEKERNGIIARQDSTWVEKKREGQLVYTPAKKNKIPDIYRSSSLEKTYEGPSAYYPGNEAPADLIYNTLTTPKGGQFQIVLPDGSKVWLNSASSLRYPVAFTGDQRLVELAGEAYFEIAPNVRQPFKVRIGKWSVDVLGTNFNISAYTDEHRMQTTLLTGSVRVSSDSIQQVLKPGEQAQVAGQGLKKIKLAYAEGTIAWKNGIFHFEKANIRTVMQALARWYDLEVIYTGTVPEDPWYDGEFPRDQDLSHAMKILEDHDVHLTLEGKKVLVRLDR